ncbi:MAG: hypothetical protein ACR2M1_16935 [Gemmatimonadaceae bacterium]
MSDADTPTTAKPVDRPITRDPGAGVRAELLFVVLPLIVLLLVLGVKAQGAIGQPQGFWKLVLTAPDWSFAAAVLFGQSIVKFVSGIAASPRRRPWSRIAYVVSLVMVLLLAPSLTVLAFMLILPLPPLWLQALQLMLFIFGVVCFVVLGGAGQQLLDGPEDDGPET